MRVWNDSFCDEGGLHRLGSLLGINMISRDGTFNLQKELLGYGAYI